MRLGAGRGICLTNYFKTSSTKFWPQMQYVKLKQTFLFSGELCTFVKCKCSWPELHLKCCSSLRRRPALLLAVSETTSLNMVSTWQRACSKKAVVTQTACPEMWLFRCLAAGSAWTCCCWGRAAGIPPAWAVRRWKSCLVWWWTSRRRWRETEDYLGVWAGDWLVEWLTGVLKQRVQGRYSLKVMDPLPGCSQVNLTDYEGWKKVPSERHGPSPACLPCFPRFP